MPRAIITRQEVYWVPENRLVLLPDGKTPHQVWTLFRERDQNQRPALPFRPVTRENAWPEDAMHDWNEYRNKGQLYLHYASRVEDHSVWILVEYTG
jgi:hypothetical protein